MTTKVISMGIFASLISLLSPFSAQSKTIHQEKSLYQNILVTEQNNRRCLSFTSTVGRRVQSCQYLEQDDQRLYFPYTRMTLTGLLVTPNPKHILMVGLGGGSIPMVLNQLYPEAKIDIVEIDPAVESVAKRYFHFEENNNMSVTISDARVYIKRAGLQGKQYDYILLDAFTGEYIPEHLMTVEFLEEAKTVLSSNGVLVANTFSSSKLYDHESVTYQQVFGSLLNVKNSDETVNRVILTSKAPLPNQAKMLETSQRLQEGLKNYGVDISQYPYLMSTTPDWDTSVQPLTDQFSPVNLLKE